MCPIYREVRLIRSPTYRELTVLLILIKLYYLLFKNKFYNKITKLNYQNKNHYIIIINQLKPHNLSLMLLKSRYYKHSHYYLQPRFVIKNRVELKHQYIYNNNNNNNRKVY